MWSHVAMFSYAIKLNVLGVPAIHTLCEHISPDAYTVYVFFFYRLSCMILLRSYPSQSGTS